jgi:hypothetical protein
MSTESPFSSEISFRTLSIVRRHPFPALPFLSLILMTADVGISISSSSLFVVRCIFVNSLNGEPEISPRELPNLCLQLPLTGGGLSTGCVRPSFLPTIILFLEGKRMLHVESILRFPVIYIVLMTLLQILGHFPSRVI